MAQDDSGLFSSWLNSVRQEKKIKFLSGKYIARGWHAKKGCDKHQDCREYNERLAFWNEHIQPEIDYLKMGYVRMGGRFAVVLTSSGIIEEQKLFHSPTIWESWKGSELVDFLSEVYNRCQTTAALVKKTKESTHQGNMFWDVPYSSSYNN